MIAAVFGEQVKIFLDEEADYPRVQVPNFGGAIGPHGFLGQPALAQGKAIDLERSGSVIEVQPQRHRAALRRRRYRCGGE